MFKKVRAARSPLSIGASLIEQALILAHRRSSDFSEILERVKGVIFLGTPHRGTNMVFWAQLVAQTLHAAQLNEGNNLKLLRALKADSETLSRISREFVELGANLQIRTFYETEKMDWMDSLV